MDWTGQKLAESLCIYLTLGFGLVAFVAGYARQDFGLMMKVSFFIFRNRTINIAQRRKKAIDCVFFHLCCCFYLPLDAFDWNARATRRADPRPVS